MYRHIASRCLLFLVAAFSSPILYADTFGTGANSFEIEFVYIGDPNNPDDTTGSPNPVGNVQYGYRIGKHEISRGMITKANNEGDLGIWLPSMVGVPGGPRDEMAASSITWVAAATFVNWLNTSQGYHAAYNLDGVEEVYPWTVQLWSSADAWQVGGENLLRHKDAVYFLPSVDEWYKAAYYDPNARVYYDYPTGSDTPPTAVASGTDADTAVYSMEFDDGPADINLAGGLSPYGTMGQGGNVFEWEETEYDLVNDSTYPTRAFRGGSWDAPVSDFLHSTSRWGHGDRSLIFDMFGFRVASVVPEPSTCTLALAATCLAMGRRRSRSAGTASRRAGIPAQACL